MAFYLLLVQTNSVSTNTSQVITSKLEKRNLQNGAVHSEGECNITFAGCSAFLFRTYVFHCDTTIVSTCNLKFFPLCLKLSFSWGNHSDWKKITWYNIVNNNDIILLTNNKIKIKTHKSKAKNYYFSFIKSAWVCILSFYFAGWYLVLGLTFDKAPLQKLILLEFKCCSLANARVIFYAQ